MIQLINTKHASEEIKTKAWEIMETSFPLCEQRPYEEHLKALNDNDFYSDIIVEDQKCMGILFYWLYDNDEYCYIEHFAINSALRNRGIGEKVLKMLLAKTRMTILEIDPPVDEISIRRQGFYERQGLILNPQHYVHSSYRASTEPHKLMLMSTTRLLTQGEIDRFKEFMTNSVMKYVTK